MVSDSKAPSRLSDFSVLRATLLIVGGILAAGTAAAQHSANCGSLDNAYGPWDYSNALHRAQRLPIVEQYHFTPDVEALRAGATGDLALDLDYTLRAFPNHPRALWAMARLQLRDGYPPGAKYYSIECYFDRALRWRPDDPAVWTVYGMYLHRKKDLEGAIEKYRRAVELQPDNPETHYNLGLAYADTKRFEEARTHARVAYEKGYPLPGLRRILERNGYWP